MTPYLEKLLNGGPEHRVTLLNGDARIQPANSSYDALEDFQSVVYELRENAGDGFQIHIEHMDRDGGDDFIDIVIIRFVD